MRLFVYVCFVIKFVQIHIQPMAYGFLIQNIQFWSILIALEKLKRTNLH